MAIYEFYSSATNINYTIMADDNNIHLYLQLRGNGSVTYVQNHLSGYDQIVKGGVSQISRWIGDRLCEYFYGVSFTYNDFTAKICELEEEFTNGYPYHRLFKNGKRHFHLYSNFDSSARKIIVNLLDKSIESTADDKVITINRELFSYDSELPPCVMRLLLLDKLDFESDDTVNQILRQNL